MSKGNSNNSMKPHDRKYKFSRRSLLLGAIGGLIGGAYYAAKSGNLSSRELDIFKQLNQVQDSFTFALIADPQLGDRDGNLVSRTSQQKLTKIVNELNALESQPAFVLVNGDLVAKVDASKISNFMDRAKQLRSPTLLVQGNHDGYPPYPDFKQMQQELNDTDTVWGSFNCGQWHFITFPCNFNTSAPDVQSSLNWLEADLKANLHKPVMVFEHYHLMPQGLSQLEWYTYDKPFKKKLIEILSRYNNVRYIICGHVHNGIQTSAKTAWTYKNINFITAPTCIASRNFGEEYPEFAAGMPHESHTGGGYYLMAHITGKSMQIRGRLVGVSKEYIYPDRFREYQDQEPLWFKDIVEYPPQKQLVNPSFDTGLEGWMHPYRYMTDQEPGFVIQTVTNPVINSQRSAYLFCREKGQIWATDELVELYQLVEVPHGSSPVFKAHYYPEAGLTKGGGYIRFCAYSGVSLKKLALLSWGDGYESESLRMGQNSYYTATGRVPSPEILVRMGERRQAFFYQLPATAGVWHNVQVNLQQAFDQILQSETFASLKIDKVLVAIGVWSLVKPGSRSGAFFDDLAFELNTTPEALVVNDRAVAMNENMLQTNFGRRQSRTRLEELED